MLLTCLSDCRRDELQEEISFSRHIQDQSVVIILCKISTDIGRGENHRDILVKNKYNPE